MTVSELIEKLQQHPEDQEVLISDVNGDYEFPLVDLVMEEDILLLLPDYVGRRPK